MALLNKIDSNVVGLRVAKEDSLKTLPGTPRWVQLEPNSYADTGAEIDRTPRTPINPNRSRRKGQVTDLNAAAGFEMDLTQRNMELLMPGFFFANWRDKGTYGTNSPSEINITAVTSGTKTWTVASGGSSCDANDLVYGSGFANSENNGVHIVTSSTSTTVVASASTLVTEAPANDLNDDTRLTRVGHQFASADLTVDTSNARPRLVSAAKTMTELDLVPGEIIYIGGDTAATKFANANNNGWARVRSVGSGYIEVDKTSGSMSTDTGTGKTVQIFFGRVLRNETGSSIVRSTFQFESTLGFPQVTLPSAEQAEYLLGSVANELVLNIPSADKVTMNLSFVACDHETVTAGNLKSGDRPNLIAEDAYNTSADFSKLKLSVFSDTNSNPSALFEFIDSITLRITNNVTGNKAVSSLGNFDTTAGVFEVSAEVDGYFVDIDALASVRSNSDMTLDVVMVGENSGHSFDIPLAGLSSGQPDVSGDEAIMLSLPLDAASGVDIDSNLDHTLNYCQYDYLPDAAE